MSYRKPPARQVHQEKTPKWVWFLVAGMCFTVYYFAYLPLTSEPLPDMSAPIEYTDYPAVYEKTVFVDTRPPSEFEKSSIPGSVNIPDGEFASGYLRFLGSQIEGFEVIVYGDPDRPDITELTARRLITKKVANLKVYLGPYKDMYKR